MSREPVLQIDRIDSMMEHHGWGPGELAERSGVAYDTIYKIRTTMRPRTSAEIVAKIAVALGCTTDYLLGLTDDPMPAQTIAASGALLVQLCLAVKSLPESRQRDLLHIAEALQSASHDEAVEQLHKEMMGFMLEEVQRIGGDDGLRTLLDRLESTFPGQRDRLTGRT